MDVLAIVVVEEEHHLPVGMMAVWHNGVYHKHEHRQLHEKE